MTSEEILKKKHAVEIKLVESLKNSMRKHTYLDNSLYNEWKVLQRQFEAMFFIEVNNG